MSKLENKIICVSAENHYYAKIIIYHNRSFNDLLKKFRIKRNMFD